MKASMASPLKRASIGRKPSADPASSWVRRAGGSQIANKASVYTARLTIDVTPGLRGRIKGAAFSRGVTASELLRDLLEREFEKGAP